MDIPAQYKAFHDRLVLWCNYLLEFIAQECGEAKVGESLGYLVERIYRKRFEEWKSYSPEEIVELLKLSHEGNYSEFRVKDVKDKYEIIIERCGSGGYILEELGKEPIRLSSRPYPWSFGKEGVLYYCGHAALFNNLFRELGLPITIEIGEGQQYCPCKYIVTKK